MYRTLHWQVKQINHWPKPTNPLGMALAHRPVHGYAFQILVFVEKERKLSKRICDHCERHLLVRRRRHVSPKNWRRAETGG